MKIRNIATVILVILVAFSAGAGAGLLWHRLQRATSMEAPPGAMARQGEEANVQGGSKQAKTWYTCGMHPEVIQDHPGNCPKCGMKLQPMAPDRAAAMGLTTATPEESGKPKGERKILYWKSSMIPGEIHTEPGKDSMGMDLIPVYADQQIGAGTIQVDPVTEQNMGVRIDNVIVGPVTKTVRTVGFVDYDETSLANVTTKIDGWVEKLYVEETGQQVHEGDPLFEFYAPELFSAQEEYLSAIRNLQQKDVPLIPRSRFDSEKLIRDARTRLEFFDISDEQIAELKRTGKVRKTMTIHAPFTGIVIHKNVVEGQYIKAGDDVFKIADLSTVWVIAKVFEYDLPYIKLGQEALMTLSYLPGKTFRGRVTYVYPYMEEKTREIPVRLEFHNPSYELKPGMYATVELSATLKERAVLVPDVAVIDTGLRAVAFVMPKAGRFELRELKTGVRSRDNYLEVLSGLAPGEKIVVSGQFLLDSESNLREAAMKFLKPGKISGATPIKEATRKATGQTDHVDEGQLYYVCPMPEHADILYDKAGKCPICGMGLVPVRRPAGAAATGRKPAYWTCPMPEHASVHEKGPGKCPICGMTLIPVPDTTESSKVKEGQSGSPAPKASEVAYWTCPMPEHAKVVRESGPGKCPLCGMNLVPVTGDKAAGANDGSTPSHGATHEHGGHTH